MNNNQRLTGALMGIPPWNNLPLAPPDFIGFSPSFTNFGTGLVHAQWRLWKLINEVELIGSIGLAGALSNNTFIFPYRVPAPASAQQIPIVIEGNSVAPIATPILKILATGDLQLANIPTSGTIATKASFHGWYSLDA